MAVLRRLLIVLLLASFVPPPVLALAPCAMDHGAMSSPMPGPALAADPDEADQADEADEGYRMSHADHTPTAMEHCPHHAREAASSHVCPASGCCAGAVAMPPDLPARPAQHVPNVISRAAPSVMLPSPIPPVPTPPPRTAA